MHAMANNAANTAPNPFFVLLGEAISQVIHGST